MKTGTGEESPRLLTVVVIVMILPRLMKLENVALVKISVCPFDVRVVIVAPLMAKASNMEEKDVDVALTLQCGGGDDGATNAVPRVKSGDDSVIEASAPAVFKALADEASSLERIECTGDDDIFWLGGELGGECWLATWPEDAASPDRATREPKPFALFGKVAVVLVKLPS